MSKVCVYRGAPAKIRPLLETLAEKHISYKVKQPLIPRAFHDYGTVVTKTPIRNGVLEDHFGPEDDIELFVQKEDEQTVRQLLDEQGQEDQFSR